MRHTLLGDHASVTKLRLFEADGRGGAGGSGEKEAEAEAQEGGEGDEEGEEDEDLESGKGSPGGTKPASQADDAKAKKLAKENKSLRDRLRALEADDAKRKREALSEVDRLKLDAEDAKTRASKAAEDLREERAMRAVERTAGKLGLDSDLAGRLVRISDLEFDDDGKVTNAEELLSELVEKWPNLKNGSAAADDDGDKKKTPRGPTNPDSSKTRGKVFTREQVLAMSPEQINENWEAVAPLLQAGALNKQATR